MQTFNAAQLLGNVGQPPEMFQFGDGNQGKQNQGDYNNRGNGRKTSA